MWVFKATEQNYSCGFFLSFAVAVHNINDVLISVAFTDFRYFYLIQLAKLLEVIITWIGNNNVIISFARLVPLQKLFKYSCGWLEIPNVYCSTAWTKLDKLLPWLLLFSPLGECSPKDKGCNTFPWCWENRPINRRSNNCSCRLNPNSCVCWLKRYLRQNKRVRLLHTFKIVTRGNSGEKWTVWVATMMPSSHPVVVPRWHSRHQGCFSIT